MLNIWMRVAIVGGGTSAAVEFLQIEQFFRNLTRGSHSNWAIRVHFVLRHGSSPSDMVILPSFFLFSDLEASKWESITPYIKGHIHILYIRSLLDLITLNCTSLQEQHISLINKMARRLFLSKKNCYIRTCIYILIKFSLT